MVDVFILIMGTENTVSFLGHLFGFVQLFFSFAVSLATVLWLLSHLVHTRLRCSCFVLRACVCIHATTAYHVCAQHAQRVYTTACELAG